MGLSQNKDQSKPVSSVQPSVSSSPASCDAQAAFGSRVASLGADILLGLLLYLDPVHVCRLEMLNSHAQLFCRSSRLWQCLLAEQCPFVLPSHIPANCKKEWRKLHQLHWSMSTESALLGPSLSIDTPKPLFKRKAMEVFQRVSLNPDGAKARHCQLACTQRGVWKGKHSFTVKVVRAVWGCSVGICHRRHAPCPDVPLLQMHGDGSLSLFDQNVVDRSVERRKEHIRDGDVLRLDLDLDSQTLSFFVNDKFWARVLNVTPYGNTSDKYHFRVDRLNKAHSAWLRGPSDSSSSDNLPSMSSLSTLPFVLPSPSSSSSSLSSSSSSIALASVSSPTAPPSFSTSTLAVTTTTNSTSTTSVSTNTTGITLMSASAVSGVAWDSDDSEQGEDEPGESKEHVEKEGGSSNSSSGDVQEGEGQRFSAVSVDTQQPELLHFFVQYKVSGVLSSVKSNSVYHVYHTLTQFGGTSPVALHVSSPSSSSTTSSSASSSSSSSTSSSSASSSSSTSLFCSSSCSSSASPCCSSSDVSTNEAEALRLYFDFIQKHAADIRTTNPRASAQTESSWLSFVCGQPQCLLLPLLRLRQKWLSDYLLLPQTDHAFDDVAVVSALLTCSLPRESLEYARFLSETIRKHHRNVLNE